MKYKCINNCPYKNKNYKVGDIGDFDEPMNPNVWESLEGEQMSNEKFVAYCREKHAQSVADTIADKQKYTVVRDGHRYKVMDTVTDEAIKDELLKKDAEALAAELNNKE